MLATLIRQLIVAVAVFVPAMALADDCRFYTYRAHITGVVDGDTVDANVDLGFKVWAHDERLRLYGIDAPETRGYGNRQVSEAEKARGRAAKQALSDLIGGKDVVICTLKDKRGKYGRYLAKIYVNDIYVNQWMIENGHAVPYGDRQVSLN